MLNNPSGRNPNILVHGRGNRAYHPALPVAMAHFFSDSVRLLTVPKSVPIRFVKIAHNLFFLSSVAGHNIAVRVNEKGIKCHVARQKPFLTVYVID